MSELPLDQHPNDNRRGAQPLPEILEALDQPTLMEKAYQVARDYEETLTSSADYLALREVQDLQAKLLSELTAKHGYVDEKITINGTVMTTVADIHYGTITDNIFPLVDREIRYENATARSLGFVAVTDMTNPEKKISIMHRGELDPVPAGHTGNEEVIVHQSGEIYIPVDGSVDVQLSGEHKPANYKVLQLHVPEICDKIQHAISANDSVTKHLRALSRIDFDESAAITSKAGDTLKPEIVKYINQILQLQQYGLVRVAGARTIITGTAEPIVGELDKFKFTGKPLGVAFSPLNNKLGLALEIPVENYGLQQALVLLNSRISITKAPQLPLHN